MIGIGILGTGFMGTTHARAYARQPGVRVSGVWSRDPAKAAALAAETGARACADLQALLDDPAIDAVSITLPTHLHPTWAIRALEAGKHVLVEKPMALSLSECDAMIRAQVRTGRVLMIAHVLRFWPEYMAVHDYVNSGTLGPPLSITAYRLLGRSAPSGWYEDPAQSGGACRMNSHNAQATCNWFFGAPRTVYARGRRGPTGAWQHALTVLDYGNVQGFAEGSAIRPEGYPLTMGMWVTCEGGTIEFAFRAGGVQVTAGTRLVRDHAYPETPRYSRTGRSRRRRLENEIANSWRASGRPQPINGTRRSAAGSGDALRRSLETGEVVRL
jgi:predicted dehydrogenase